MKEFSYIAVRKPWPSLADTKTKDQEMSQLLHISNWHSLGILKYSLHPKEKKCNYDSCQSSLSLTKFTINIINIYVSKLVYYKAIFPN